MLNNKIDFVAIISVKNANPNGDPLNGNRPRTDINGYGEISDVCLKRKIRNRWMDMGEPIFVQSDDRNIDGFKSLKDRAKETLEEFKEDKEKFTSVACETWLDVRAFGQLFAFKEKSNNDDSKGLSVGIRGPVSIHPAFSVDPVMIEDIQITKSVNSVTTATGDKSSDTMGMKHRVKFGLYVTKGSINCQLAEKTGFDDEDAEKLHEALKTLFENDASSARPEGSILVEKVYWFKHNCQSGQYPSFQVHDLVNIKKKEGVVEPKDISDYDITPEKVEDLALDDLHCEPYSIR
jgi:CRISPR-associated protein Csd2